MLLNIMLCVLALSLAIVGWLAYVIKSVRVDHDDPDYQRRVEFLWPGSVPHQPTALEKSKAETEKGFLIRLLQRLLDQPDGLPYLVNYPLPDRPLSPAIVIAPGGGYMARAEKSEGIEIAQWLNSIGVAAFVLNYRLDRHPAPLSDAQRAIQYLRANAARLQIDPARIGIMGFSAGGHLASTAGTHFVPADSAANDPVARVSSRPDFMVLAYPVIGMGEVTHRASRKMLLGLDPAADLLVKLSSEKQVKPDTSPTFIWAPITDRIVDYRNTQVFADALVKHGVLHEVHLFPKGKHGSGLAQKEKHASAWPKLLELWLKENKFLL